MKLIRNPGAPTGRATSTRSLPRRISLKYLLAGSRPAKRRGWFSKPGCITTIIHISLYAMTAPCSPAAGRARASCATTYYGRADVRGRQCFCIPVRLSIKACNAVFESALRSAAAISVRRTRQESFGPTPSTSTCRLRACPLLTNVPTSLNQRANFSLCSSVTSCRQVNGAISGRSSCRRCACTVA